MESKDQHATATSALTTCQQQLAQWKAQVVVFEAEYAADNRRPTSHCKLSRARRKVATLTKRLPRMQARIAQAQRRSQRHQQAAQAAADRLAQEQLHLQQLAQDNCCNPHPVRIQVRIDAGFASRDNLCWLIEMGYDIDAKARQPTLTTALKEAVPLRCPLATGWQKCPDAHLVCLGRPTTTALSYGCRFSALFSSQAL